MNHLFSKIFPHQNLSFRGVVAITLDSHPQGPWFILG